jgi:hypothetical protein
MIQGLLSQMLCFTISVKLKTRSLIETIYALFVHQTMHKKIALQQGSATMWLICCLKDTA